MTAIIVILLVVFIVIFVLWAIGSTENPFMFDSSPGGIADSDDKDEPQGEEDPGDISGH